VPFECSDMFIASSLAALPNATEAASAAVDGAARPPWFAGALLAFGVAMLTAVSLRVWYRRRRRSKQSTGRSARERLNEMTAQHDRDSLESLMVEVQELTRTCTAQIDNRSRRLEAMIESADQRLADLRAALAASQQAAARPPAPEVHTPPAPPRTPRLALDGDLDPFAERVFELNRAGLSPVDIAKKLGEQVGKIELILAMEARRSA